MSYTQKLLQTNKNIFRTSDLAILWEIEDTNLLLTTIKRYIEKGTLHRIYKGLYSKKPLDQLNKYEIACAIGGSSSYVSGETVLINEGVIMQNISEIIVYGQTQKSINVNNQQYTIRFANEKYLLNRVGIINNENYSIATKERALVDIRISNPNYYIDNEKGIDQKELKLISSKLQIS